MFAAPLVEAERRADGALLLRSGHPLGAYPASTGVLLRRWARERPERVFLAERDGDGWRTVTYAEMLASVRRLAAALLDLGLGPGTPIAILSENSLAHATVALAGQYAGIPVAPVSPAYSTSFGDLRRLGFILDAAAPAAGLRRRRRRVSRRARARRRRGDRSWSSAARCRGPAHAA